MKYAIIIPDGAADTPLCELDGKTPLQAAETPNMDWIAANGKCGTVHNIPDGMPCGSDVAILSLLGYDPADDYTGRAPLEAAAMGLTVAPDEWVFRCNLVSIIEGLMADNTAGHISNAEAAAIIEQLNSLLADDQIRFWPGIGYRHLMTCKGEMNVTTTPPHDILTKPVGKHLPVGKGANLLREITDRAHQILAGSEINAVRKDLGENPATDIWLWGQGKMPQLEKFATKYGKRGAVVAAVDLVRGLATLIDWDLIDVEGATGYVETNFAGKGAAAVEAIDDYDIVCVHVEAPDEAGHNGNAEQKVWAINQIDQHVVGPVLKRLQAEGDDWRILVLPDHPTPVKVRTHTYDAVPFALAGKDIQSVLTEQTFDEATAEQSDLHIERGCEMMEFFLKVR